MSIPSSLAFIAIININTSCQAVIGQFFWLFVATFIKILTLLEAKNLLRQLRTSAEEKIFVVSLRPFKQCS